MAITSVVLHVADVQRSVDFYRRHLHAEVIEQVRDRAVLDFVTAPLELRHLPSGQPSTWAEDDATRGFRHLGLKVSNLDEIVRSLDGDDIRFRSRPLDIDDIGVRNAFFFDPDGTVIELVENHLKYHVVIDGRGVAAEQSMPAPDRPRFDHVGHTVEDLEPALHRYASAGFTNIGRLQWPPMHLEFLRADGTVIELFKIPRPSIGNPPVVDSYGFAGVTMEPMPVDLTLVGDLGDGRSLFVDPDDMAIIAGTSGPWETRRNLPRGFR